MRYKPLVLQALWILATDTVADVAPSNSTLLRSIAALNVTTSIATISPLPTSISDWVPYISNCAAQFTAWSTSSLSLSYKAYLESRRHTADSPLTQAPSYSPSPSCCNIIDSDYYKSYDSWNEKVYSAQSSAEAAGSVSYFRITSTEVIGNLPNATWASCNAARTVTNNIWTWVDNYPRANVSVASNSCPGSPSLPPRTIHFFDTSTIYPGLSTDPPPAYTTPCATKCNHCTIIDQGVEILYWPVSLTSSGTDIITVLPTETGLVTADYDGTVLTSPTVYLRFPTLYAGYRIADDQNSNPCPTPWVGKNYSNVIIPIPTDVGLSTVYFSQSDPKTKAIKLIAPFDYGDLPPNPLPKKRWLQGCGVDPFGNTAQDQTLVPACATIDTVRLPYKPRLKQPLAVHDWDPAWENCTFSDDDWFDTYDPPYALQARPAIAIPITSSVDPQPTAPPPLPAFSSRTTMFNPPTAIPTRDPSGSEDGGETGGPGSEPGSDLGTHDPGNGESGGSGELGDGSNGDPLDTNSPSGEGQFPSQGPDAPPAAVITIGDSTITGHPGEIILPSLTLHPEDPAATISGHTVYMATDGVMVDGVLTPFSDPGVGQDPVMTLAGIPFTRIGDTNMWAGAGTTVSEGAEITLEGSVVRVGDPAATGSDGKVIGSNGSGKIPGVKAWRIWVGTSLWWTLLTWSW